MTTHEITTAAKRKFPVMRTWKTLRDVAGTPTGSLLRCMCFQNWQNESFLTCKIDRSQTATAKNSKAISRKPRAATKTQAAAEIRRKTRPRTTGNQKNLQKTENLQNWKLHFFLSHFLSSNRKTVWYHGSCKFKVRPNVFQLDPEKLEARGPTTSRPARS